MMNPYATRDGEALSLFVQMGVGTNVTGDRASGPARLRGYLEIDEKKLEAVIKERSPAMRDFFGSDSDGDLVIDSGLAFQVYNTLRPYVTATTGIFDTKRANNDRAIAAENRKIPELTKKIQDEEAKLKRQYASVEAAQKAWDSMSQRLDSFSKSFSGD